MTRLFSFQSLQLPLLGAAILLAATTTLADPFPPTLVNGAAHFPPVAWPAEPASPLQCGTSCGEWLPYTRFQGGITDPRTRDPSNGGTAPQNYVNIASSCVDKTAPSVYYALRQGAAPDGSQDTIMFRWRVEQIANTYATGPSAGAYASSDPWSSALWSVLFDVDGDGYLDLAAHLDGSSGSPSASIDRIAGIWSKRPTQSLDYLGDPTNVKLVAHNPAGFVDTTTGRLLNFGVRNAQNEPQPTWPNGSAETTWDYGTTRAKKVTSSPCNEYFVDYQIPVALLDASAQGGPKITRTTPLSMVFCTANSLNNPFQKDCAINASFIGQAAQPAPFGDYISFNQAAPYSQPIISSVVATPPNTCPGSYTLTANVQDTLAMNNGVVVPSVKAVRFFYYYDADGNGLADDGGSWVFAADGALKTGSLNTWMATWSGTGLPKGSYLIGVQALDDNTKVDDGVTPSGVDNRTFSYVAGDAQNRIYVGGTPYAAVPTHTPAMAPSTSENWWGNPSVTGNQIALVGLALNNCGVAPTLTKTASTANVGVGGTVDYTFVVSNTLTQSLTVSRVEDALPSGFSYVSTTAGSLAPTASPTNGATGTIGWNFSPAVSLPPGGSGSFVFRAQVAAVSGQYNNTATAATSFGTLASAPVPVAVDGVRLSLSKTPSTYQATADGATLLTYTLRYANDSTVAVAGATLTDALPSGVTYVSCSGAAACGFSGGVVTWTLASLAGGASGTVQLNVTVNSGYSSSSIVNTATLAGTDPAGAPVSQTATATVAVPVAAAAAPAFTLAKTASATQVAPGANVVWTLSYANTGNAGATGVTLTDPMPAGFSYVSCTGGCTLVGGVPTWNLGSVAASASGSVTVTAAAATPFTAFNPATNTASLNWSGNPGSPVTASAQTGVTGQSCSKYYFRNSLLDVGGSKGSQLIANQPTAAPAGAGATKLVAVPASATGYVTALEFYTDPVTASSVDFNGAITSYIYVDRANGAGLMVRTEVFDFNTSDGTLTAIGTAADIQMNGSSKGLVKDSATNAAPTFNATGTLQRGHRLLFRYSVKSANTQTYNVYFQYDGNAVANPISGGVATDAPSRGEFCVTPPPNLSFTKTVNPTTATAGVQTPVQYTLRFANTGVTKATGVQVVDTLPAGVTFVSATLNGAAITPAQSGPQLTFTGVKSSSDATAGEVSGGASGTLVVNATVEANATGTLTNTATISSAQTEPSSANASTVVQSGGGGGGSPQLAVQLTADRTSAVPGDTVTYTVTVANIGTAAATNVVLAAPLPTRSYYTYSACTGGCSVSGGAAQWPSMASLAVGASASYTFTMVAGSTGLAAGVSVVPEQASATATSVTQVDSNTVNVSISGNPQLAFSKSVSGPATPAPGDTLTYTLVVTNSGSVAALGVRVLDPVPPSTAYAGALMTSAGTGSFDPVNNRVVFDVGSLASGASAMLSFAVTVGALNPGSTTIVNTATASAQNAPTVTAVASKTAGAQPVLTLTKQAPAQTGYPAATLTQAAVNATLLRVNDTGQISLGQYVGVGSSVARVVDLSPTTLTLASPVSAAAGTLVKAAITYTLTYENTGSAAAESVVLTDALPPGLDWVAAQPTAAVSGNSVTWSLGTLQPRETGSVQLVALPQSSGTYVNQASIQCGACGGAVQASATTSVGGLVVSKRTTTPAVAAGNLAEYVIEVRNTSALAIAPVSVTDVLPSGFTFESTVAVLNNGAPVVPSGVPAPGSTELAWGSFTVQPGQMLSVQFQARVALQTGSGTYQNDAGATPLSRAVAYDFLRSSTEDVVVLGTDAGLISGVLFHDVDNNGVFDAAIDLPLGNVAMRIYDSTNTWVFEETTDASGHYSRLVPLGTWTVEALGQNVQSAQVRSGSLATRAAPSVWTGQTTATGVPAGLTLRGNFINPVNVTVASAQAVEVDLGFVAADALSDLAITKTHTGTFSQGQAAADYRIVVSNVGAGPTAGTVTVTDTLPAGLTATSMAGTGWSCTLATLVCTRADSLAAGDSFPTITLTVAVAPNAAPSVTNVASVGGGGEINTTNNAASDPTTITPFSAAADLTLAKTHAGNFVQGQTGATYSLVVTNIGASASAGVVTVTDLLPAGLTATAMGGTGWSCTLATLVCTRTDSLAASASFPSITVTVSVAANAASTVTNQATVAGGGETNTTNNAAVDPTMITAPSSTVDLGLAKSHSGNFRQGQNGAQYQLVVSNLGAVATAGAVTVTEALPAGLTATAIAGTGWSCTLATLSCTRADALAAGASWPTITVTVAVAPNAPGVVTNVATVSGGGDTTPGNNTASDATTVEPAASAIPALGPWGLALLALLLAALAGPAGQRAARRPR